MSEIDYKALLEHSYTEERRFAASAGCNSNLTRLEYLSACIFDFNTYDGDMDRFFATKAIEVCTAITDGKTFDYIGVSDDNHKWYLAMCNMPFFAARVNWGTSIRAAWWDMHHEKNRSFKSWGLWVGEVQLLEMIFDKVEDWHRFIKAIIEFAKPEMN